MEAETNARGRLIHRTASLAFVEATIYDEAGRACAHSTGTFKYVRKRGVIDRLPSTD